MRVLNKLLFWVFFVVLLLFVGLYVLISFQGRQFVRERLISGFERPVTIGEVRMVLPLGLRIDDVDVDGALKAKEVRVHLGILGLIQKELHITSLSMVDPVITVFKTKESGFVLGSPPDGENAVSKSPPGNGQSKEEGSKAGGDKKDAVRIDNLMVKNGRLLFFDVSGDKNFELELENIELKVFGIAIPYKPIKTRFDFSASVFQSPLDLPGGTAEGYGWINVPGKDMDAKIKVVDEKGRVALDTHLVSENNSMQVKGKLNIANLSGRKQEKDEEKDVSFKNMIFNSLQSSGVNIGVDFSFRTKMDDFRISQVAFSGIVGYGAPGESSGALADDIKDIGRQIEELGKELYKKDVKQTDAQETSQPAENKMPE